MTIRFVDKPEIRLRNAPLSEVVCQVKFPPNLRLSKDAPVEFQEVVRDHFPELNIEQGVVVQFPSPLSPENPAVEQMPKIFRFLTADGQAYIALAPDFIALTNLKYTHWGDFLLNLELAAKALMELYRPPYGTRIGLRFVNRITQQNTKCENFEQVLELFRPELTCFLRVDAWTEPVEMLSRILLQDDSGKLSLRYGFGKDQNEPFFLLDFDYFEEGQLNLDNLYQRLEHYHTRIYAAFRWCLLDESLKRFEPLS